MDSLSIKITVRREIFKKNCEYEKFGNHQILKKFWKLKPKRKILGKQYFENSLFKHENTTFDQTMTILSQ